MHEERLEILQGMVNKCVLETVLVRHETRDVADRVARDLDHLKVTCHGRIIEESRNIHRKLFLPFEPARSEPFLNETPSLSMTFVRANERKSFDLPLDFDPEVMSRVRKEKACQTEERQFREMVMDKVKNSPKFL